MDGEYVLCDAKEFKVLYMLGPVVFSGERKGNAMFKKGRLVGGNLFSGGEDDSVVSSRGESELKNLRLLLQPKVLQKSGWMGRTRKVLVISTFR